MKLWHKASIPVHSSIRDAVDNLNKIAIRLVLVVDAQGKLQGTISDGDIRRGLLKGLNLSSSIESIIHRKAIVVRPEIRPDAVRQLMVAKKIQQVPVVDKSNHVVGLHLWDEITTPSVRPNLMVIMAGGKGTRLRPYTETCPKPMITVAGKPILEHIIIRGKQEGINRFILATHYKRKIIETYFGKGEKLDVEISYLRERKPLGTAGALGLLTLKNKSPIIVTNGDVVSNIKYGDFLDFHNKNKATATMAVRSYEWQHPFGVVKIQGTRIKHYSEKPIFKSQINAGVYVLSTSAVARLKQKKYCDMSTFFENLISTGEPIAAYPIHEYWLDIGTHKNLRAARKTLKASSVM